MKTFEELKEDLLTRAKNAGECQRGYAMGLRSETKADLLIAITENWFWVFRDEKIVDAEYLEDNFTEEELLQAGIYIRGIHKVKTSSFAFGSATVKAFGSATVKTFGSATVEAFDSATVEAFDSATVEAFDSATVEAFGSATVEAFDSATVEAFGSATVKAFGSATVEAYGDSYVEDCIGNIRPQSDYAIVKDYYSHKIYIKKGKFEIIEV
ncbi:hypothetical protein O1362_00720 [Bacteroides fragilis]|uniref:hypothetical protein n=1 Tax=Bacteroides fragilis TaxID=817 RepID=UPI0022AAC680|nr:hypothetical protein [Bacteroides fragilis]MCZ2532602.1 hypothetical protein [Bacteroides fragilis]